MSSSEKVNSMAPHSVSFCLNNKGNEDYPDIPGIIEIDEGRGISIYFDGYSTFEGDIGAPVFVEVWQGDLRLVVFDDLKKQNPRIISLSGAQEGNKQNGQESKSENLGIPFGHVIDLIQGDSGEAGNSGNAEIRIDWDLLYSQKSGLVELLRHENGTGYDELWGIVHLLESILDNANKQDIWKYPEE